MKSRWIITAMIMLALLLSACKAEEGTVFEEVFPTEQGLFRYEGTGDATAIAVNEEGLLYAVSYIPQEDRGPVLETEYVYQTATQCFRVYDLEGYLSSTGKGLPFTRTAMWATLWSVSAWQT